MAPVDRLLASVAVGNDKRNGRDGILGSGDDSGVSGDCGGNGGVGEEPYSAMSALVDVGKGCWVRTVFRALWTGLG
nr:hypothetical protein [Tanacetum cinerariifolium]